MRYKNVLMVLLILMLMLFMMSCDWLPGTGTVGPTDPPPDPEYVDITMIYQRVDDNPDYPRVHFDPIISVTVYINGNLPVGRDKKMESVGNDVFRKDISQARVGYPSDEYGDYLYKVYVLDHAFSTEQGTPGARRAHRIWFISPNGTEYEITKIRKEGGGAEYTLVRFDKDGVPHEE